MNKVTVSLELMAMPNNWISAEEAREAATSLRNTKFVELMDFIMKQIKRYSNDGAVNLHLNIPTYYYRSVYEQAQEALKALGYEVSGVAHPTTNMAWNISW